MARPPVRSGVRIGAFDLWKDGSDIPVFAWRLRPGHTENWTLHHLSDRLRMKGWLVPAYPLPDALSAPMPAERQHPSFHH